VLVTFWIVSTIGITVPERLRQRQRGIEAAENAKLYRIYCAELEYKARFNTIAVVLDDLREKLPDPDGSLAEALNGADPRGYQPRSDIAASLPKSKSAKLQGAALRRPANGLADDGPGQGLSFTDYELRLPGPDKIFGTDDDSRMVNGVIVSPVSSNAGSTNADSNP
jgi:fructose-specific component phosphotransferase system IIB-like protein